VALLLLIMIAFKPSSQAQMTTCGVAPYPLIFGSNSGNNTVMNAFDYYQGQSIDQEQIVMGGKLSDDLIRTVSKNIHF
jgi:hypothetical protein